MIRIRRFVLAVVLACISVPAAAASLLELNFGLSGPRYDAVVPLCQDPWVTGKITARFAEKESQFWNSSLQIVGFERLHETAFRAWHVEATPRRHCSGIALVSDGKRRPVHYTIVEDGGWLGVFWGVDFCIVGLDRDWAYNPNCRMARP
jgi:hypothetical protein